MTTRHGGTILYLGLLILQPIWHAVLPQPIGSRNILLAVIAALPLLLPLRGVLAWRIRALTVAGFLVVPYFVIGVMETWSNPLQRTPAVLQALLATGFIVAVTLSVILRAADRTDP